MFAPEAIEAGPPQRRSLPYPSSRTIIVGLLLYFGLHVACRVLASGTVELDEAEQVLLAQELRWGYGPQPPLYTWLQFAFFNILGQNVFALSLLKHLLLCGTFAITYCTARVIATDERTPLLAMLSLLFVPQFAWESHRDLTHSVAATTFAAATLLSLVRLVKLRRTADYLLFGLFAALGLLAKYNAAIFLLALLVATTSVKEFRSALKGGWMLGAVLVFILLALGHFSWLGDHGASPGTRDVARSHFAALQFWVTAVLSFSAVLGILMAFVRFRTIGGPPSPFVTLLGRTLLLGLVFSLVVVLVWKARFKDRWFQPVLFALPLCFALWARPRLTDRAIRVLYCFAAAIAVVTLVLVPVIPLAAQFTNRPTRLNLPYAELATALRQDGVRPRVIVADSRLTGGNLKLHFPSAAVTVPELRQPVAPGNDVLLIWDTTRREQPPKALVDLTAQVGLPNSVLATRRSLELPMRFMSDKKARWAYVFLSSDD